MIEVICNDRLGKKIRVKCNPDDTIGDLKKLLAAQTGTRPERIRLQKYVSRFVISRAFPSLLPPMYSMLFRWYTVYKDHITLSDYEVHDGFGFELYYN